MRYPRDTTETRGARASYRGHLSRGMRWLLTALLALVLPAALVAATQEAKLVASDGGSNQEFGLAVARHGNVIVVGAPRANGRTSRSGAAYVYQRGASGWTEVAKLTASRGRPLDRFGESVAIDGPVIVVGARGAGLAYVFQKPAGGWSGMTETATLRPSSPHTNFAISVAIDDDTVVAGASSLVDAAFVFEKPASGWRRIVSQSARLTASDAVAQFGVSVAISGETVVVGDRFNRSGRGAAYVFVRPGGGWANGNEDAKLTASTGTRASLGTSVALAGDTVFVGGREASEGALATGAVYAFRRPPTGWINKTEDAKLLVETPSTGERLGWSLAASGQLVLAGALGSDSAYVFVRPDTGWAGTVNEFERIQASDGADGFGASVGLAGSGAVVGTFVEAAYAYEDVGTLTVELDIEPTRGRNVIRRRGIAVAILSDAGTGFDPILAVDPSTLTLGLTGTEDSLYRCGFRGRSNRDFNRDGIADLYCSFFTLQTGLDPDLHESGDEIELVIRGETFAGEEFVGADTVVIKRLR